MNFFSGNQDKGNKEKLTSDHKKYFNGFDELGGSITKYSEAVTWFEGKNDKIMVLTNCIIALEKPSSWIFSGVSNETRKLLLTDLNHIEYQVKNDSSPNKTVNVPSSETQKIIKSTINQSKVLEDKNNEYPLLSPPILHLDPELAHRMPHITEHETQNIDEYQINTMKESRFMWDDCFKLVNTTRMKRIALMYLEMCESQNMIDQGLKWKKIHKGKPSKITNFGDNESTRKILKKDIDDFLEFKHLWSVYKAVFNQQIPKDPGTDKETWDGAKQEELKDKLLHSYWNVTDGKLNVENLLP